MHNFERTHLGEFGDSRESEKEKIEILKDIKNQFNVDWDKIMKLEARIKGKLTSTSVYLRATLRDRNRQSLYLLLFNFIF